MNVSVVILVLLPMFVDVVYSDESTHEISSVLELFPEFVQVKDEIKQLTKGHLQIEDKIKELKKELMPSGQCPHPFVRYGNRCYLYIAVEASWMEAQMYCRVFGGSLVSIETYEEWDVIRSYLRSHGVTYHVWIGGTDLLNEGEWRWTNGNGSQEMIQQAGSGIWDRNQPDDYNNHEDCLILWTSLHRGNDYPCTERFAFICEAY